MALLKRAHTILPLDTLILALSFQVRLTCILSIALDRVTHRMHAEFDTLCTGHLPDEAVASDRTRAASSSPKFASLSK